MKIQSIELFKVPPRWLFLKMTTDDGIVGWGEPVVEGKADSVAACVSELRDQLIGQDPRNIEAIWQTMYRCNFYRGGPVLTSAMSGIDCRHEEDTLRQMSILTGRLMDGCEELDSAASGELESCLRESLDHLQLCGAITYLDSHCDGKMPIFTMIAAYDFFETVIETLLPQLNAMMVTVKCAGNAIHLQMQMGCHESMPELTGFQLPGGTISCVVQEEDIIIKAHLPGGDGAC